MAQPDSKQNKNSVALATMLLGVVAALALEVANAALINPALGPVVITETAKLLPGTNPDGSIYIIDNGARLTFAPGGTYGSYSVVNNTTDMDILGFAVSNPASTVTFVLSGNNGAWNMTPAQWTQPSMFGSIISIALNLALGSGGVLEYVTPEFVFGSFESNFGTAGRANLYYSRQSTSVIGPGTAITETFFFGPAEFASDFVAFLVPTGALTGGTLGVEDIQIVRGTATVVPLPATVWLLATGVAALGLRRLRAR